LHISRKQQLKGLSFKERLNPATRTGRSKISSRTLMNKPSHHSSRKPTTRIRKARNPSKIHEKSRNSATVQDSPIVFLPIPSTPLRTYSPRSLTPYTRYEKKEHAFLQIVRLGRLEEARQEDREIELTSRCFLGGDSRLQANPHRRWGGVFYGAAACRSADGVF
jgi:hypothetical protein